MLKWLKSKEDNGKTQTKDYGMVTRSTVRFPKKNPTDINLLDRSVVEAAIGEKITPKRQRSKKPKSMF